MNVIVMAGIAAGLAATPPTGLVHHVEMAHFDGPVQVSYHGDVAVRHKTVGMSLAGRPGMSTARCVWQADLRVERRVADRAASRVIDAGPAARGSRHGDCITVGSAISAEVARKAPEIQAALAAAARADQPQLAADLGRSPHANARLAR